eukprot:750092-Hanusia_phi.AAC.2
MEGMVCRGMYYGDNVGYFYDAVLVGKSKSGWLLSFVGFEHEAPQDTFESHILFADWAECKALFYDEKRSSDCKRVSRRLPGVRVRPVSCCQLLFLFAHSLASCQDTREEDIVMLDGSSKQKGKQDKQQ